ncbi:MAG: 2-deoxy-D-gluconate 3-dehydrogenase [Chloroflexi bacterium]|nr:2-deoxy-D-gluconate 3-dehydrogenase [Chloroflexota bacterium]MBT17603.1 2-deoxy-D-gluconate 3-dehydrogenase [Dehalococcoidia bacterium]|tara:strand:+ start:531 stop:1301 length:771 start_codon:yes stop_codon:yes gene_type:complete
MGVLDLFNLTGKVAIITGASRGLGRSMACALAEAGAYVALVGRDLSALKILEADLANIGTETLLISADVSKKKEPQRIINEVLSWRSNIDILVNNAGTVVRSSAVNISEDDWEKVIELNLNGAFRMAQAAARVMLNQRSGKIINIGSVNSVLGAREVISYAASKGGILQVTRAMASELAAKGIQVNCILPGYFETDLTKGIQDDEARYEMIRRRTPAGRWGKPDDLAGAVVYLASAASDYVTGSTLTVDGGFIISA